MHCSHIHRSLDSFSSLHPPPPLSYWSFIWTSHTHLRAHLEPQLRLPFQNPISGHSLVQATRAETSRHQEAKWNFPVCSRARGSGPLRGLQTTPDNSDSTLLRLYSTESNCYSSAKHTPPTNLCSPSHSLSVTLGIVLYPPLHSLYICTWKTDSTLKIVSGI